VVSGVPRVIFQAKDLSVNTLGLLELVLWLFVVQVLSFSVLPFVAWMCPQAPDRGYGLSKVLGVFLFAALVWLSSLAGLTTESNRLVFAIFLFIVLLGVRGYRSSWLSVTALRQLLRKYGRSVEGIFLGLTLFYGVIRFLNPEIFWGEKPMDSTFLNFFVRNQSLPPQDPWAAGSPMSYYYLGMYVIAAMLKLTGIAPAIGYNLAMATVAGWIGSALFTLCLVLTRSRRFSVWAVWLLLLASNPEVLRLSVINLFIRKEFNFDTTFWPSTRVFTSPSFLEYTSWSLLFADLHAHVIAIPFTVTALALAAILFLDGSSRYSGRGLVLRLSLGGVVGALFGLNTWDFISFGGVVGVLLLFARIPPFWKPPTNPDGSSNLGEIVLVTLFSRGIALVWDFVLFGVSAATVVWLYNKGVSFRPAGGWGWVASPEFNSMSKLFRVMGYWLVGILATVLLIAWLRYRTGVKLSVPRLLGGAVLFAVALMPGVASQARGIDMHPWGTYFYCAVLAASAFVVLWQDDNKPERSIVSIFAVSAALLIAILEVFFLLDRMNTLFKGYMAVWMLSGIVTMMCGYYAYRALAVTGLQRMQKLFRIGAYVFVALLLIGTSVNVYAIARLKRVPKRVFTLDGIAYLREMNPDDAAVVDWFNRNVTGTPVILEAQGDGYREFTRISMHTGLPTVLGWEHHARQRGLSNESALERRKAIQAIYTHEDIELTKNLLVEYGVDFIVIGKIERNHYRRLALEKFEAHPELFTKVISFGDTHVFVTFFSKYNNVYRSGVQK
jgi:YYY domain-containing protein